MLNQTQTQPPIQSHQEEQISNPYPNTQIKDSNLGLPQNSKYSSQRPYQSQMDFRNSSNRERSRSNDHSPRSFNDNRPGQNNYNMYNRNNRPYYNRDNNDRQFDSNKYRKERNQYGEFSGEYNSNYGPTKDDCLIVLPKNFYNFIAKDFDKIKNDLKRELKDDIYNININYSIQSIPEKIFRFTTSYSNNYPFKTKAIRIICDYLFDNMKRQYEKTTYLKIIFLIPEHIIGNIIGINGKNINQTREETNTKIEVFSPNNAKKFRKVEVAGAPQNIAEAGEKIYDMTRKYFNFKDDKIFNRNEHSPQRDRDDWRDRRGDGFGMNNYKERDRRYYEGNFNKDYDNGGYNNDRDRDYKGMYNKERNDYRDMGFKNDYKNRDMYRNYGGRDMKNNQRNYWDRNNNNNFRDNNNYRDYRDNGPRFRNNYDKGNNNKYYYDKNRQRNNNENENEGSKNRDNWSNKSFSRKSVSDNNKEHRSYNEGNDEWPDEKEKEYQNEENKGNNNEQLDQQKIGNDNINNENQEGKDFKENGKNENDNMLNEEQLELKKNLEVKNVNDFSNKDNNIGVSNIAHIMNNINMNNMESVDYEREKGEIDDKNNILASDVEENDKSCKIIIYLSSEEIKILSDSKKDNIWINLENSFHCNISKITKIIDNQEISLITFNGTPKQNTKAIYQLQKYLLDTKNEQLEPNKLDN